MILTFCYFQLQISSFKRQRLGESKKTEMYKYAISVSFLLFYAVYIHLLWGKKKIVCSQTKNFFPHINSGYSACRGKNPSEMEIFRRTKKRKTAFLRLFRSIFLFFVDKILRTECGRFRLAGFTGKRKKRRTGGFRLLSSCEKAFRSSRPHRGANGRFLKAWDWRFDRLCRKSTLFFFLCALGRFLRIDYLCLCEWRGSRSRE